MLQDRENTDASSTLSLEDDDSLCAQLYRCYAPAGILAYLRRHLPTQEDAEDLLLDVFLAALEYEPRLASLAEDEQRAWLVTVARNKMIDHHRRTSRRRFLSLENSVSTPDGEETMPEELVVRDEEHDRLRLYLQQLSTTQQEVLQLRFTAGLRCTEIARTLHRQDGAIRTMLSRALNTLRGFYEQKDKGDQY